MHPGQGIPSTTHPSLLFTPPKRAGVSLISSEDNIAVCNKTRHKPSIKAGQSNPRSNKKVGDSTDSHC